MAMNKTVAGLALLVLTVSSPPDRLVFVLAGGSNLEPVN